MSTGPLGHRIVLLVTAGLTVGACAGDQGPIAFGADTQRPAEASIESVRLDDVAAEVGLDFRHSAFHWATSPDPAAMMGGGLCWIDYDGDGWLDLYVVDTFSTDEWGRWRRDAEVPTSRLYRNEAGRFRDVTAEAGAAVETRGNGCVAADLNGDGWTDLYVTSERENTLLWNDAGDGFVDDEDRSGAGVYGWHAGAAVGDVDGNGWPDLFVAGYADMNRPIPSATKGFPNTHEPEPDLLLLNDGPGAEDGAVRFREVAAAVGIEPTGADYGLGVVLVDFDGDGDLDIHVANDTTPNQLYDNRSTGGEVRFVELGVEAGVGDVGAGMGIAADDADGDDRPDLIVTNQLDEHYVLARNTSDGALSFADAKAEAGVPDFGVGSTGWGAAWVDLDLDGDLDVVIANGAIPVRDLDADRQPMLVYENDGGTLREVSSEVGLTLADNLLGRGLAAADYDNDGDIDLAVGTIGSPLALFRNSGAGGASLTIEGAPVGATAVIELDDGRTIARRVVAGDSYLSSADPRLHVGLGAANPTRVTVTPLGGEPIVFDDVDRDTTISVAP